MLMSALVACPWPLYVNMLMKDVVTWRSSLDVTQIVVPDSVEAAFNQLLDDIETRLGVVFVSHTLAFITVANNGLCEVGNIQFLTMRWLQLVAWHSGRTSVFDRRAFPVLRSTYSGQMTTYVCKPSATGQLTRETQPFVLSGLINEW